MKEEDRRRLRELWRYVLGSLGCAIDVFQQVPPSPSFKEAKRELIDTFMKLNLPPEVICAILVDILCDLEEEMTKTGRRNLEDDINTFHSHLSDILREDYIY